MFYDNFDALVWQSRYPTPTTTSASVSVSASSSSISNSSTSSFSGMWNGSSSSVNGSGSSIYSARNTTTTTTMPTTIPMSLLQASNNNYHNTPSNNYHNYSANDFALDYNHGSSDFAMNNSLTPATATSRATSPVTEVGVGVVGVGSTVCASARGCDQGVTVTSACQVREGDKIAGRNFYFVLICFFVDPYTLIFSFTPNHIPNTYFLIAQLTVCCLLIIFLVNP